MTAPQVETSRACRGQARHVRAPRGRTKPEARRVRSESPRRNPDEDWSISQPRAPIGPHGGKLPARCRIYNTLTGQEEEFSPARRPGQDVRLRRHSVRREPRRTRDVLHHSSTRSGATWSSAATRVHYVQNFTDIDDKLIARAERLGMPVKELAERHIAEFFDDMGR